MGSERLKRTIGYTLSRPAAYLIVGLVFVAVVVAIAGLWSAWVILGSVGAGVVLLGLLVLDSLTDPNLEPDVLLADIDPNQMRDPALRGKVRQALEYYRAVQRLAKKDTSGVLDSAHFELPQLEQAVRSIYQMALRLQEFRGDTLIPRDLATLEQQKTRRGHLTQDQEEQLGSLQRLTGLVQNAEKEIDAALADLGRSYAEMQAIKVTPELKGRAADAFKELEASSQRLADLAQGYDEVYRSHEPPTRQRK